MRLARAVLVGLMVFSMLPTGALSRTAVYSRAEARRTPRPYYYEPSISHDA